MADAVTDNATPETQAPIALAVNPSTVPTEAVNPAQVSPTVDAAAEAAKAAAKPEETKAEDTVEAVAYEATGDPGLDLALDFVGKLGISEADPAMKAAIEDGNFDLIKAKLAAMGDKAAGWERMVALAERAAADAAKADAEAAQAIATAVHTAAGGAEQWKAVRKWASQEATPEEKSRLNAMLTADPFQARAAALMIVQQYNARASKSPASALRTDAANGGETVPERLTRREYAREVDKLARKHGSHNLSNLPEYRALQARLR